MIAIYLRMFRFLVILGSESVLGCPKSEMAQNLLPLVSFGLLNSEFFRLNRQYANVSYRLLLLIYRFASWLTILDYTNLVLLHGRLASLPPLRSLLRRRLSIHVLIFTLLLILLMLLSIFTLKHSPVPVLDSVLTQFPQILLYVFHLYRNFYTYLRTLLLNLDYMMLK